MCSLNSFSAMRKLTMDYCMPTKILIEDVLFIGMVKAKYLNLDEVERELSRGFRN